MNRGASWLQSQLKAAEELLHAVDRTAKTVSTSQGSRNLDERAQVQGPPLVSGSRHERQSSLAPSPPRGHSRQGSRSRSSSFAEPSELLATSGAGSHLSVVALEGQSAEAGAEHEPAGTPFSQLASAPSFSEHQQQQPFPGKATSPTKAASSAALQPPTGVSLAASPAAAAKRALPPLPRQAVTAASQGPQPAGSEPRDAAAVEAVSSSAEGATEQPAAHDIAHKHKPAASPAVKQREAEQEGAASPAAVPQASSSSDTPPAHAAQATSASAPAPTDQANDSLAQQGSAHAAEAAEDAGLAAEASSSNGIHGDGGGSVGGATHVAQDRQADGEAASEGPGLQRSEQELEEAKSLAGGAVSQRELRLQQVVARLKQRLEQYKQENQQLEEMLRVADAKAQGGSGEIERLEDDLARAQAARISAEAALQHAMATKDGELRAVKEQLEGAQRKCGVLEEQLQHLQEANAAMIQERKVSEGQLIQSLRREVEEIERLLEEERAAHAATRKAAAAREHELEGSLQDSASSMARMQRDVEDRSSKLAAAEERCTALEHEVDSLAHQLRAVEGKLQKQADLAAQSSPEVLQQRIAELEAALQAERGATSAAEQGRAAADEELVRLKAEVGSLKRQLADTLTHSDAGELQRRLKEVTDLLYLKQTQLERIASEKAAQQLGMERELAQARQEAAQVKRRALTDRAIAAVEDAVVPMDTIGDAYHRLANNNRVGGAVKAGARFLDATASQVVRILKQYPMGRLVVFAYVLGIHLFIYLLLHRLQRSAFSAEHSPGGGASDPLTAMHDALHRGDAGHEQLTG